MSWVTSKAVGKVCGRGRGLFAREAIASGEKVVVWDGVLMSLEEFKHDGGPVLAAQVEEGLLLTTVNETPGDWINHSCDPNVGIQGQVCLVAMRDIAAGEELCYDYAFTDSDAFDEFDCACGCGACRGRVTGEDWKLTQLQDRYGEFFSDYLKRRIAAMAEADQRSAVLTNWRPAAMPPSRNSTLTR